MRRAITSVLLAVAVLCAVPAMAADEDLFDTKTAVEQREKGRQFLNAKEYDQAIEALEKSVSAAPDDADAFYLLGYAYYLKGKTGDKENLERAKENFDEAYQLNPNFSPTKIKAEEPMAGQTSAPEEGERIGSAAPASKQSPAPAAPEEAAPAAPSEQPKQ
jgi:tetratricopeptide (TPR) repeat protein